MAKPEVVLQPTSGNLFKYDGPAGTVVFLVALPLCLGIALASGVPLVSGIIAGVVGGVVVSLLSGSHVSVSGPAAGLTVIVASALAQLGSLPGLLTAVALSGLFQIVFSLLRAGVVGDYVPNSVIKGMLSGIGIVIVLKQIPHALGRDADYEGDLAFLDKAGNTLSDIAEAVLSTTPGALMIALVSLALLIGWEKFVKTGQKFFKLVPAPLAVVAVGIALNEFFRLFVPWLHVKDAEHLVSLPVFTNATEFFGQFTTPDFARVFDKPVLMAAGTIAVVGSIETLLSLEAADRLDPYKRISPPNRELFAQGVGNLISGLIGGLPLTSVVVRTSANVYAGARTRLSSFIHGLLLLLSVLTVPHILNRIPLSCLAAILIMIGYKLARIEIFKDQKRAGWDQFLPFVVTVIAIVFTDLLTGVLVGMGLGIFFVIRSNHRKPIIVVNQDNHYLLRFNKDATFINKSVLKAQLREIPDGAHLYIDATKALYVDHDIREVVQDFAKSAPYKNLTLEFRNFPRQER